MRLWAESIFSTPLQTPTLLAGRLADLDTQEHSQHIIKNTLPPNKQFKTTGRSSVYLCDEERDVDIQ